MTKQKTTKRTLLTSVLSLVLCMAMLIGTTFAWFTDSVTSGKNRIQAGNLDVAMSYKNTSMSTYEDVETPTSPEFFKDVNGGQILWEPGAVAYANFKVENLGTLALKYSLQTIIAGCNYTAEGKSLADVLTVKVMQEEKTYTTRELAIADAKGSTDTLESFAYVNDNLVAKKSDYFTVILYWEPGANDNAFNVNPALYIDIELSLVATQAVNEEDSFNNQYDVDATHGTYVELNEGDDILKALASAKAGLPMTIKLLGDIEWPTPAADASDITPASSVLINGNSKTITATGNGVYAIGDNDAPITFKNLTVVDESVYTYENGENAWEFTYLELGGNNTYENVTFTDGIMVQGGTNTFVNCEFIGHNNDSSELGNITMNGVWVYDGNATFNNCTFTGTRGMKICDKYAGGEVGTVLIDGCRFIGLTEKPGIAIDDHDTQDMDITIKNSTFIQCQSGDAATKGEAYGVAYIYETDNTKAKLEGNIVDNKTTVVATGDALKGAIANAGSGDMIMLAQDTTVAGYAANQKLVIDKNIVLDLNGKTITTECGWGGIDAKGGCTIKNGTINHTGNTAAIKAFQVEAIENVTINVTETAGKTKGGIVVQSGADTYIRTLKNVTITGATNGIECYRSTNETAIGIMKNVKIDATQNGIYINGAGKIGKISNCEITAGDIGINAYLAHLWHISLNIENSKISAGRHGIDIWDEAQVNTGSTVTFNYDDATTFVGGIYDIKVTLQKEISCTINGVTQTAPCKIYTKK